MKFEKVDKQSEINFDILCTEVLACYKCPRMCDSQRVLSRSSGALNAEIMFIGEAPGRLGADGSGIPFHGDKAGHNFEELLTFAKLDRSQIFVTNAVLCNPKDDNGNNATPNADEIKNCSSFLRRQILLLDAKIVVTLGINALTAIKYIENHDLTLRDYVKTANNWFGKTLIPLYHPGQRAMIHRSFANQRSDYQFIADQLKKVTGKKHYPTSKPKLSVSIIIDYLFYKQSSYTYFALHKLFYLIEYKSVQKLGHRLTDSYIIRQKDGPYCTDLHLFKIQKALPYIKSKPISKNNILVFLIQTNTLFENRLIDQYEIDQPIKDLIEEVLSEHGRKSNTALKRTVYFTRPMRNILAIEMEHKLNLINTPIEFYL